MSYADLLRLAGGQHGFFTTSQAAECGLSRRALTGRATSSGEIEHAGYGLWRIAGWPASPNDDLYAIQTLAPFGTFSHETALALLDLGDVIPRQINITIPERSRLSPRSGIRIHRSRLGAERERLLRDGLWISTPARALLDAARTGIDPDHLQSAAREAKGRGMLADQDIEILRAERIFASIL